MTEKFTASNGATVELKDAMGRLWRELLVCSDGIEASLMTHLDANEITALREFFQHERDVSLNRWRSKEHPEFVVYGAYGACIVWNEITGASRTYNHPNAVTVPVNTFGRVAREYFTAHPAPKPAWHDAEDGEIWVVDDCSPALVERCADGVRPYFRGLAGDWGHAAEFAKAARRIWPPVESEAKESASSTTTRGLPRP